MPFSVRIALLPVFMSSADVIDNSDLYNGVKDFAVFALPDGSKSCLQMDVNAAKDTISRIKILEKDHGAHIAFAHDISWALEGNNQDELLISCLSSELQQAARDRLPYGLRP